MRREVRGSLDQIQRLQVQKQTRGYFDNVFEEEGREMIDRNIEQYFSEQGVILPDEVKKNGTRRTRSGRR